MLQDFRRLDNKSIDADLCIVGAGAAGITIARRLKDSGLRICLLESGGLTFDEDVHMLNAGEDTGFDQGPGLSDSRLRYLGGSTNHWVGHCAPYSDIDFKVRDWIPNSGWPISLNDLEPYYRSAQRILELGPFEYDLDKINAIRDRVPAFNPGKLHARAWQMSPPTRFGNRYREELEKSQAIKVYLHATVTQLETDSNGSHIKTAHIKTLDGHSGRVHARYFVLACGGIENARLLLVSNSTSQQGIGNDTDLVGRFYTDHLRVEQTAIAHLNSNDPIDPVSDPFNSGGITYKPMLCPAAAMQERDRTLNWCAEIRPAGFTKEPGYLAAREIRDALESGQWPDNLGAKIQALLSNLDGLAKGVYERTQPRPVRILCRCETAPDPDSRIKLSGERDALGQLRVTRHWRVTLREKRTMRSAMMLLGEEFGRLGLGRMKVPDWLLEDSNNWPDPQWGVGVHHIGATRMATSPAQGVVDANCRVHTTNNLYIAGASVFPTCGYTHPTLTVCAISLRLAEHLETVSRGKAADSAAST